MTLEEYCQRIDGISSRGGKIVKLVFSVGRKEGY